MNFGDFADKLPPESVPPLVCGLVFLLAGWGLYWLSLNLVGGVLGGGLGLIGAEAIAGLNSLEGTNLNLVRCAGFVIGLVAGILLVRWLHRLAFFLSGSLLGGTGFFLAVSALRAAGEPEWAQDDMVLAFGTPVAGLIVGVLSVACAKYLVALSTSLIGGLLVMQALEWPWHGWPLPAIALGGFAFQVGLAKPWKRGEKRDDGEEED
jgi:hypothetical protein